jgi:protein-disulfide isomerase
MRCYASLQYSPIIFMDDKKKSGWVDDVPSRTALGLGVALGIGAIGVIGFLVLLPGAMGGDSTPMNDVIVADAPALPPTPSPTPPPEPSAPGPVTITVSESDHIRGNPDAPVTIVEWSDFECPFCSRFHPSVQQAISEYGDDVRWIYRHFPLESIHAQARPAAEASECAAEQGKFWEFADAMFAGQSQLGKDFYLSTATSLGLNDGQFSECVESRKYEQKVRDQEAAGINIGVRGTPGSFVNGIEVPGAVPYPQLQALIESALN